MVTQNTTKGFTLIEIMIVIIIIGIISAIAYPNYKQYTIKTKRTDMMSTLQSIASDLQAQKAVKGSYIDPITNVAMDPIPIVNRYANQDTSKMYNLTINLDNNNDSTLGDWIIQAVPKSNLLMKEDGTLTLDDKGIKCRLIDSTTKKCGVGEEWRN